MYYKYLYLVLELNLGRRPGDYCHLVPVSSEEGDVDDDNDVDDDDRQQSVYKSRD
jgi:hypothetical protein